VARKKARLAPFGNTFIFSPEAATVLRPLLHFDQTGFPQYASSSSTPVAGDTRAIDKQRTSAPQLLSGGRQVSSGLSIS
jgi:hypothetical protein